MHLFRGFVAVLFVALVAYTAIVIGKHGWNLLPVFFGDIMALTWPGQFNVDFLGFLLMSGLWVSWRHHFSMAGCALGLLAVFGGIMFLSLYLFIASTAAQGDYRILLLGKVRASA